MLAPAFGAQRGRAPLRGLTCALRLGQTHGGCRGLLLAAAASPPPWAGPRPRALLCPQRARRWASTSFRAGERDGQGHGSPRRRSAARFVGQPSGDGGGDKEGGTGQCDWYTITACDS